ncbi:elongation factor P--(R)-beta-lysine ligase [Persephonella sp.]
MDYIKKAKVLKAIRDYFDRTGAVEVLTDVLRPFPNLDPHIYPLEVYYNNEKGETLKGFLHTSPEYEMKKIISKIRRDIYQITKVFRNFEGSSKHKVEFTMLEWYRTGYNLEDLMDDTQNIFMETAVAIYKKPVIEFKGKTYDLRKVEKITVDEAFYKYTSVYPENYEQMIRFLKEKENLKKEIDYEEAFFRIYAFYVEPELGKENLTFIYNYPPQFSALALTENGKGKRFEAYIDGLELVNGYQELRDSEELKKRLEEDARKKQKETGKIYPVDLEFILSSENIPECSGASLGIDRLFMVLLNKANINEI